jgi:hypothetical protein
MAAFSQTASVPISGTPPEIAAPSVWSDTSCFGGGHCAWAPPLRMAMHEDLYMARDHSSPYRSLSRRDTVCCPFNIALITHSPLSYSKNVSTDAK